MRILVIDVGGTHVKVRAFGHNRRMEIPSGPKMTANKMVVAVKKIIAGWKYDGRDAPLRPGQQCQLHRKTVGRPDVPFVQ
jgi:hypothetical protein